MTSGRRVSRGNSTHAVVYNVVAAASDGAAASAAVPSCTFGRFDDIRSTDGERRGVPGEATLAGLYAAIQRFPPTKEHETRREETVVEGRKGTFSILNHRRDRDRSSVFRRSNENEIAIDRASGFNKPSWHPSRHVHRPHLSRATLQRAFSSRNSPSMRAFGCEVCRGTSVTPQERLRQRKSSFTGEERTRRIDHAPSANLPRPRRPPSFPRALDRDARRPPRRIHARRAKP